MLIYKILRAGEWAELERAGESAGAPIDVADGYIHFSTADQAAETAARHFAGETRLKLLAYDADDLSPLEWEPSRGGQLFPHLYAPLRRDQALWVADLPFEEGRHVFPEGMV
ncbi:Uncharacterized conserved protein, DUF952 family [Roseivivax lentus]|uniref:Uncharacterized conserved protein, DUF952 family n=1 Tax=Roseivivax lentus TaxID=633194 RepID=A0A1N7L7G6_9RHOB|nr:DUF952 domain-containing protein [Roseivivax lentus]SIS69731.1 Uncharacterized conserved protein, DUF952 family [Roseivivax lentus]